MKIKEKAKKLKSEIPVLLLALKDKDTPLVAKILACITVGYALSPIDLIPDFIPVLGYLDDVILLPALIALTVKCIPSAVWQKNKEASARVRRHKESKKWYYAIPIIGLWSLLIGWLIKRLWF